MPSSKEHILDIQKYFLIGVLLLLIVALFRFAIPFLATMIIAGVIVAGVYPVHKMLHRKLHFPASVSTLISMILVATIILAPLILLFFLAAHEATGAYTVVSDKISQITESNTSLLPQLLQKGFIKDWIDKVSAYAPISASDIISTAKDFVGTIGAVLLSQTTNILKNLSVFILHMIVFLLTMFYFLRDGDKLIEYLNSIMPLSEEYRKELIRKLSSLSHGIIYGIFGAAIIQGALVGLGFTVVGINNGAFWGAIAALLSPLPYIGTSLIWVPAVITLAVGGHWLAALFLLIWGMLIVGMADNVIKPYLIGSATALHPLAVLLVLLGGTFAFGLKGLLFGPFILTLTLAFLHIYKLEYSCVLDGTCKTPTKSKKKKK